jgi:hypothetical protein
MKLRVLVSLWKIHVRSQWFLFVALAISLRSATVLAADKLTAIHSSQSMSQSMPWIAKEAGLFKKYSLDFDLVHIASSPTVTAAMLGGNAEVALTGGEGIIRAYGPQFRPYRQLKNLLTIACWPAESKDGTPAQKSASTASAVTLITLPSGRYDRRRRYQTSIYPAGGPLETMARWLPET